MVTDRRTAILEAALSVLASGEAVTLDSAAKKAGLTKPGLMHHFPTKESLMLSLVQLVAERWEVSLRHHLGRSPETASPSDHIRAYVDFALTGEFDRTDMVILSDPRLLPKLTECWAAQMSRWFDMPPDIDPLLRGRLNSARLLADGAWFARSTNVFDLNDPERAVVRSIALGLLEELE